MNTAEKMLRWYARHSEHGDFHYLFEYENNGSLTLAKVYSLHGRPYQISVKDARREGEIRVLCEEYLANLVFKRMNDAIHTRTRR